MEDQKQQWIYQTVFLNEMDTDKYVSYIKKGYCVFDIKENYIDYFCSEFECLYNQTKDNDFLYEYAHLLRKKEVKAEGDDVKHFQIMLSLANQKYVKAYCSLGICYSDGYGVEQDSKKAYEYLSLAASQGYLVALNALGVLYYTGEYVKEDKKKAFEIMLECSKYGLAVSQCNVAIAYFYGTYGELVPKDFDKAFYYASLSAEQGHRRALYVLGEMYYFGMGTNKDDDEALYYFYKALIKGYEPARRYVNYLGTRSPLLYRNELWYKIDE